MIRRHVFETIFVITAILGYVVSSQAAGFGQDTRHLNLRDADHYTLQLTKPSSSDEWAARCDDMKTVLRLRSGILPEPERSPLNAQVFDERKGEGFVVAKVYFESLPGYLVTGNLYRPAKGNGPFPAIVTPHGHWGYGRLSNGERGSIPARCIDFARMGFVVFSIDMIGYNDSFQFPHDPNKTVAQRVADKPLPFESRAFRGNFEFPDANLYGFNLGGLQLWNAIRAVDFLGELPYVDPNRIGATGASGGASQTIFLMSADDRIKVAAPVNIIGAEKHPGCRCENMPYLWIDMSTIELSSAFAPKPLLLMSANEDPWTNSMPQREYPLIRSYFELRGSPANVKNVHINAGHNYNAETRAAVYEWFVNHLGANGPAIKNPPPTATEMEQLGDLRVFPDGMLPENALSGWRVMDNFKTTSEKAFIGAVPETGAAYPAFAKKYRRLLRLACAVEMTDAGDIRRSNAVAETVGDYTYTSSLIGRKGKGDSVFLECIEPVTASANKTMLIISPEIAYGFFISDGTAVEPAVKRFLDGGYRVYRVHGYASGEYRIPTRDWNRMLWPETYNRNDLLNGIQDVITALAVVESDHPGEPCSISGYGNCGVTALMGSAIWGKAASVAGDMGGIDPMCDDDLVRVLPIGGIRRIGDIRTAMVLLMQSRLVVYNYAPTWDTTWTEDVARRLGFSANLNMMPGESSVAPEILFPVRRRRGN